MATRETNQIATALVVNASVETIFGQERYLEKITESLYAHNVHYARELVALTEQEFNKIVGRISMENHRRVQKRLQELKLNFRGRS